jgi:hypothetical protein
LEEVDYFGDVPRDATDEDWSWLFPQHFLEPTPIPYPVVRTQPLLVWCERRLSA